VMSRGVALQSGNRLSFLHREIGSFARWGMVNISVNSVQNRALFTGVGLNFTPHEIPFANVVVLHQINSDINTWRKYYRMSGIMDPARPFPERLAQDAVRILNEVEVNSILSPEIPERLLRETRDV
jgi:hypothetical protein